MPDHAPSANLLCRLREEFTFQISVDTDNLPLGYNVADAAVSAGVTILEMGTPLIKCEGVRNVVPGFRARYPDALLLADMKTMDGGALEARAVFGAGGNIIDFLALSGEHTARAICAVRDEFRASHPDVPRLVFADLLLPQHGADPVGVAKAMLDAGVDGVGVHLQADARKANPSLFESGYLSDVARQVHAAVGDRASVQVVGGLTVAQACDLARAGLRAFVISANLGVADSAVRYGLPPEEQARHITHFMQEVLGVSSSG